MSKNVVVLISCLILLFPVLSQAVEIDEIIHLNGYFSFEYEQQIGDTGKGDKAGSFDLDLFDLVINVMPVEELRLATDLSWEHGTATENNWGNVAVEYAFAEYTVFDWLRVRAGKMFVPFGIYNEIHTAKPVFISVKEPLSTNKNNKFGSGLRFYPRWAVGLEIGGAFDVGGTGFDYSLQVSNGEQETTNPFEEDDNKQKAFSARVRAQPAEDLEIGLSAYADSISEWDVTSVGDEYRSGTTRLLSYGGHLIWNVMGLGVEGEFVMGTVKPSTGDEIMRYGATVMLSYLFLDRYTPYFRFEYLDPDTNTENDQAMMFVYGINVRLVDRLFIKLELDTVAAESLNSRFGGGNESYTEFKGAIVFGF